MNFKEQSGQLFPMLLVITRAAEIGADLKNSKTQMLWSQ